MRETPHKHAWQLLLLVTLCSGHAGSEDISTNICDRERSRAARAVLRQHVLPMTAKADHQLTEQCPFHPLRDLYGMQDAARHKHRGIQWKCGFCDKVFRTDAFLDQHMDNNHQNEKHPSADVCLADLCEVLHCDHFVQGHGSSFKSFQQRTAPCRPKLKGQLKHNCQDIADVCFPIANSNEAALMHEYFVEHFCEAHTCNRKEQLARLETVAQLGSEHRVWGYRILVGLLMLFMVLLYAGIWAYMHYYMGQTRSDLQTVSKASAWSKLTRKTKAY